MQLAFNFDSEPAQLEQAPQPNIIHGGMWDGFEVIHTYSAKDALEDGTFTDVSELAREKGFRYRVLATQGVIGRCTPSKEEEEKEWQSFNGRMLDVLWMAYLAARRSSGSDEITSFQVSFRDVVKHKSRDKIETLWAVVEPIAPDDPEPVVIIMFPDER